MFERGCGDQRVWHLDGASTESTSPLGDDRVHHQLLERRQKDAHALFVGRTTGEELCSRNDRIRNAMSSDGEPMCAS